MRHAVLLLAVFLLVGCAAGTTAGLGAQGAPDVSVGESPAHVTTTQSAENESLAVHFIDVGQSSSTLVVGPSGETMLVDTGDYRDDGASVLRYLQAHGVERIDYLVTTHADADHIGGNAAIIDYYETEAEGIGAVYDPGIAASTQTYEAYLDAVERHNVTLYQTLAGDEIPFDGARTTVLGPPAERLAGGERNENSIVLKLTYGNTSVLLPGDAGRAEEAYLVDRYGPKLNATVLQVGHHGSDTSTSAAFLDAVSPRVVSISSAYDSPYGHPDEAVLARLAERSIPAYWTAVHGHTVVRSDGETIAVTTQQSATTNPLELRSAAPVRPGSVETPEPTVTSSQSTPVATDGGTTAGADGLAVAAVHADARGDDADNLNDEYVVFENTNATPLDLSDYAVRDEAGHEYRFPAGFTLEPGATVTLHTGTGADTATDLYWGSSSPVWNNGGDTVAVFDAGGALVAEEEYS